MTTIVDSIRKHQKLIVLGAALAIITLYIIPVDQIASAVHPGIQKALDRIAALKAKINANNNIPQSSQDRVSAHLDQLAYRLLARGI